MAREDRQDRLFANEGLEGIDRFLVPHTREEFGYALPDGIKDRTEFVGPIARRPDPEGQRALRARYALGEKDFLLVSTAGGGGFADSAQVFTATVLGVHELMRVRHPHLRHVFVRGPLSDGSTCE